VTEEKLLAMKALGILIDWLEDNIECGTDIIFDNDFDNTDSEKILPGIIQALKIVSKSN
jgi:hypothetical protein